MTDASADLDALDAAFVYGARGWRVAPVKPGLKVPAITDWPNRATTDAVQIDDWWHNEYADCGVCIVTGRETGLWVLDVDVANGKPGMDTLRSLVDNMETSGKLPETLVAQTPSGGVHYFWTYPKDAHVHNSASNRLGPGLDVRGEGGQVNAAPTSRDAGTYRWIDGRAPWDGVQVAAAPAWLLELVVDRAAPAVVVPRRPGADVLARARLSDPPAWVGPFNDRHDWAELLEPDGWILDHTDRNGDRHWVRPGKDPRDGPSATVYADIDCLHVWSTSLQWLPSNRSYDKAGYHVHGKFAGDFGAAGRHYAAMAPERTGDVLVDLLGETPAQDTGTVPGTDDGDDAGGAESRIEQARMPLESADFWNVDPTTKDFLIAPFLARGRAHALYAAAKQGKSYVVLQAVAAACVPEHESWADVPDPLLIVLYLDYEMTEDDLRERLRIFGYGPDDDYSRLHYIKASLLGADLDTYQGGLALLEQARAWAVDLVVIDTMSRAVSGEENDADTVRKFYQHTGRLLKAHGIAWLRIDHAGKDSDKGQRGSSSKNDDVDVVWRLEKLDAGSKLTRTHSRVFWIEDEILLSNVHHPDGSVHHIRAGSIDQVSGLRAKAAEWVRRGIPLDTSRDRLRDEYAFSVGNGDMKILRAMATELQSMEAIVPLPRPNHFATGTDGRSAESSIVPSLAPPIGGPGDDRDAGTVPGDEDEAVRMVQRGFGLA